MEIRHLCFIAFLMSLVVPAYANSTDDPNATGEIALTIYNGNFALVKENRTIELKAGENSLRFTDVAALIDPTSVHFKSLTDPAGVTILEQNYEYDLVSAEKLLGKYVDQPVIVHVEKGELFEGKLLSFDENNLVLSEGSKGPLNMIRRDIVTHVAFTELPSGFITRPTLSWLLSVKEPGQHLGKITYLTDGVKWKADYVLLANADDTKIDLNGWVTIDNKSGATYENAALKLIAGDVHRVQPQRAYRRAMPMARGMEMDDAPQFEERAFFEYHLYTLQRRTTLKDRETKQISLLSAEDVPIRKIYTYNGSRYGKKVRVNLEFENKDSDNLGMPLPKGKIRVYKTDIDGSLEFIGEDMIDHTPKDEKVRTFVGNAFDIVGERKQMATRRITQRVIEYDFEIEIRNHKEDNVTVVVEEDLQGWPQWEIRNLTHRYAKKSQNRIEFHVPIPSNGKIVLKYTIRYSR